MTDNDFKSKLMRGNGGKTLIKLIIVSIIVGACFNFLGISASDFWRGIFDNVKHVISTLGENVSEIALTLATYLVIGAAVVIPIWVLMRIWSSRK